MNLQSYIEHTLLRPDATKDDLSRTVDDAIQLNVFGICIASSWIEFVKSRLIRKGNPGIQIVSVVGFPHGNSCTAGKVAEAKNAIECGANEIDMVMHIGWFKSGHYAAVENDIKDVVEASKKAGGQFVKVILETGYLLSDEIVSACQLAEAAGADFVKTSTGFGPRGASIEDVKLMKATLGNRLRIKAAGGIRSRDAAMMMIAAGASRIGTSSAFQILEERTVPHKVASGY